MRIAVVGAGISGMVAARLLHRCHDVTVFEAGSYIGGHTNTVEVADGDRTLAIDTGFIVFNERTYPNFCKLLKGLGVAWRESDMGFSAAIERSGVEYCGANLSGLFAQRRNLLRPSFWKMVRGILRFYREALEVLDDDAADITLGEYLRRNGYSRAFVDDHLIPMAAAVWSADPEGILEFPVRNFVRFFDNHGFLQVDDRPQWLTVEGGSREYVSKLVAPFRERIRTSTPVESIRRDNGVRIRLRGGEEQHFDAVVLAVHSDTALRLLEDADSDERAIAGAIPYQENEAVLHTDTRLMPQTRKTWSSWNYHVPAEGMGRLATVTYWMNQLQGFQSERDYLVTLNRTDEIDSSKILYQKNYHHPIFGVGSVSAQARREEIQGRRGTWWCGAWWGFGFHEDGCRSGVEVGERLGESLESALKPGRPIEVATVGRVLGASA